MKLISELEASLTDYFDGDKRLLNGLVKIILALFVVQTVNLVKLAHALFSQALPESSYRRLQRFFSGCKLDYNSLARWVVKRFGFEEGEHHLIFDRTNWKWGKKDINILSLCIAHKQVAIPLFFSGVKPSGQFIDKGTDCTNQTLHESAA